jgi:ABC-type sugar transport system ATPase subunit
VGRARLSEVVLKRVAQAYGDVSVLEDIDLEGESGSFVTLVGASGCG